MNAGDECPNHAEMTATGTPRRCISVPQVCRASCNRMTGNPAAFTSRVNRSEYHCGWNLSRRLLVVARDEQNRLLRVILQPVDIAGGTWRLRTVLVGGQGA